MELWKTIRTRTLLSSHPWLSVVRDEVLLPSGRVEKNYYRVPMPSFASTIAFTREGKVLVLRHYKHGAGKIIHGLPAGHIERGEKPLAAAKRELLEETGYTAKKWESLGAFVCNANRGCGTAHFFLARGAVRKAEPVEDDMEECQVLTLSPKDAWGLLERRGRLSMAGAAALGLAFYACSRNGLLPASPPRPLSSGTTRPSRVPSIRGLSK